MPIKRILSILLILTLTLTAVTQACGTKQMGLSIVISPKGAGSVTPEERAFDANTQVVLTAIPAEGYVFDRWGGEAFGSTATITIFMKRNYRISANFKEAP